MDQASQEKFVDLEIRIAHQDAAIEELTTNSLLMEKRMLAMENELLTLKQMLKSALPGNIADPSEETPPPHY